MFLDEPVYVIVSKHHCKKSCLPQSDAGVATTKPISKNVIAAENKQ
jgi:hypothetical protein